MALDLFFWDCQERLCLIKHIGVVSKKLVRHVLQFHSHKVVVTLGLHLSGLCLVKVGEIYWILSLINVVFLIRKNSFLDFIYIVLLYFFCFLSLIIYGCNHLLLLSLIERVQVSEPDNSNLLISSGFHLFLNILPVFTMLNEPYSNIIFANKILDLLTIDQPLHFIWFPFINRSTTYFFGFIFLNLFDRFSYGWRVASFRWLSLQIHKSFGTLILSDVNMLCHLSFFKLNLLHF